MKVNGNGLMELNWLGIQTGKVTNLMITTIKTAEQYLKDGALDGIMDGIIMTQHGLMIHAQRRKDLYVKNYNFHSRIVNDCVYISDAHY